MKQAMEAVKQQNKANALWEKAAASSGTAAALLYGEGLQQLPPYAASSRKDILEKIKKADPEDIKECTLNTRSGICPTSKKCREW
ncbi:MAG: hypothetical protein ACLT38_12570 [Akkermansia sp.]